MKRLTRIPPAKRISNLREIGNGMAKMHSEGLEPPTLGSEDRCSIQLSYECSRLLCSNCGLEVYTSRAVVPMRLVS